MGIAHFFCLNLNISGKNGRTAERLLLADRSGSAAHASEIFSSISFVVWKICSNNRIGSEFLCSLFWYLLCSKCNNSANFCRTAELFSTKCALSFDLSGYNIYGWVVEGNYWEKVVFRQKMTIFSKILHDSQLWTWISRKLFVVERRNGYGHVAPGP